MSKYFLLLGVFLIPVFPAHATSGACSSHGGVDCSITGFYATCNDGTQSSVPYSSMDECQSSTNDCPQPTIRACTTQADYQQLESVCLAAQQSQKASCGQMTESYASLGIYSAAPCDTSIPYSCTLANACQAEVAEYQSQEQQYQSCVMGEIQTQQQEEQEQFLLQQQQAQAAIQAQQVIPVVIPRPVIPTPLVESLATTSRALSLPEPPVKPIKVISKSVIQATTTATTTAPVIPTPISLPIEYHSPKSSFFGRMWKSLISLF